MSKYVLSNFSDLNFFELLGFYIYKYSVYTHTHTHTHTWFQTSLKKWSIRYGLIQKEISEIRRLNSFLQKAFNLAVSGLRKETLQPECLWLILVMWPRQIIHLIYLNFSTCKMGLVFANFPMELLWGLNKLICVKYLEHYLAHLKCLIHERYYYYFRWNRYSDQWQS